MNLLLYFNPRSGSGAAEREAEAMGRALRDQGHNPTLLPANTEPPDFRDADALIVLGGDGTIHSILDAAAASNTPIYHFPTGTENLFAREFGMSRNPATLLAALARNRITEVDLARCNGRAFAVMCGVGPDASVIHRMARTRQGRITHLSYGTPILAELRDPALAPIHVWIDGREVVGGQPGWLVVANSRQYALRIDPAPHANMTDGLLDVSFFPARSIWTVLGWTMIARMRLQRSFRSFVHAQGREVRIESPERPLPMQLDGEAGNFDVGEGDNAAIITVEPNRLRVLDPGTKAFTTEAQRHRGRKAEGSRE